MIAAKIPDNELSRIKKLRDYHILDTLPEKSYDDLTKLAAYICKTPIALVSLIDSDRQWFKSRHGLDASETPRDVAFCAHAILQEDVFIIEDSSKDERFHDNPLVTGAPFVQFYAGAPLITPDGYAIGTLCAINNKPSKLDPDQLEALKALSRQVVALLDLRLTVKDLEEMIVIKNETEIKLKQAIETAIEANKAKSRFLALMSHEVRTPMNGVLGTVSMLSQTPLTNEQQDYLNLIKMSGDHLLTIINDILDISKIEAGKMELESAPFSYKDIIRDTISLFSTVTNEKKIYLTFTSDMNQPHFVYGDSTRFKQILTNLVSNAIKFTNTGGITISADSKEEPENLLNLHISVEDTGIGIADDKINQLFTSFTQADSSITRKYGGTGLGLSICKSLIELMGGNIYIESCLGKGTKFSFKLTLPIAPDITKEAVLNFKQGSTPLSPKNADRLKILVAEDNSINQKLIKSMIKKTGYQSDFVENGKLAVEAAFKKDYRIILMDVMMPELDGIEASKIILSNCKNKVPPIIIAMTANASNEDKEICFDAGMSDFLSKPYKFEELSLLLEKWSNILFP